MQSICCDANTAAVSGAPPCSDRVNFVGTVDPAFAWFSAGGAAIGGWKPPNCAVHVTGRSNAAVPSVALFALPCKAPSPRPRLAKPAPDGALVLAAGQRQVGGEDRVAPVDEARAARLELQPVEHEPERQVVAARPSTPP